MTGFEDNIRKVTPYTPGEQPKENVIKLNTNENPYSPTKEVKAVLENIDTDKLRLYPDPCASELIEALSREYEIPEKQIFAGVGSDDVLAMSFLTFFNGEKKILFPDVSYSFYKVWAGLYGIPYEEIKVDDTFRINPEDYYKENGGVIIANPNAPTSLYLDIEEVEAIVSHNKDSVVIIDEAYIDFAKESAKGLINKYENLLVVQTFSKSRSMAGMRIGFAFGSEKLITYLNDAKYAFNSYTLNLVSIKSGVASLSDRAYFEKCVNQIVKTREESKIKFRNLGFKVLDSATNFVFVKHEKYHAKDIFIKAKERGIYVRYWDSPRINEYLRITIGTESEMESLFYFLHDYIQKER